LSIRTKTLLLVLCTSMCGLLWSGTAAGAPGGPFGFGGALVGAAPVGAGPSLLAVDPATHTLYVSSGNNVNGPNAGGDTVSVIDTSRCAAQDVSRCPGPWPTITAGSLPSGIAVDRATDTVYVTSIGEDTVSVFNGATCNATDVAGCGQTPAEVPVGSGPLGLIDDPASHTVYVGNFGPPASGGQPTAHSTVSMIDTTTCNASHLVACPTAAVPTVGVTGDPSAVSVDRRTHTVYVTTIGPARAENGWSVFDADTCNATVQTGCGTVGKLIGDPAGPNDGAVDSANDTLYTANYDNTISAFDLRDCNATDLGGCSADTPGTVTPLPDVGFDHSLYAVVDHRRHSVYVSFQGDDALAVIDTRVCNGENLGGCAALHPRIAHTGADPEGVVLDPSTQTLYTADEVGNEVSVLAAARCNAANISGCRHSVPSVAIANPGPLATDDATHTAYVTAGHDAVSMINTAACNASHLGGCETTPPRFSVGRFGSGVAIDSVTHTVYVSAYGHGSTGTVSAVDELTCNATDQSGCAHVRTLRIPNGHGDEIAVDQQTDTVYVATNGIGKHPNRISVFKGASCNAETSAGCMQKPHVMNVAPGTPGGSGIEIAFDAATDTVFATNNLYADPTGHVVYVFDGGTCNAHDLSGCGQTPATVTVGNDPVGLAIDPATDTVYAVVHREGDYAASIAAIDGATCNGSRPGGCGQTPAMAPTGFGALFDAVDPATRQVFTANLQDQSVSAIDGTSCDGTVHTGCGQAPTDAEAGDYPTFIAVDSTSGTVYVSEPAGVSVLPVSR
jgi:DNA-binding beta-propeller fold protein YncE